MDAELWHHQATAAMVDAPRPATADDLTAMNPMGRSAYADAVRAALRARRVSSPVHDAAAAVIDVYAQGHFENLDLTSGEEVKPVLVLEVIWSDLMSADIKNIL